jgi:hypothetical protein
VLALCEPFSRLPTMIEADVIGDVFRHHTMSVV